MKKLIAILAAISMVMMFGTTVLAVNPWENDGDRVDVEIDVAAITELWSNLGTGQARSGTPAPVLDITNAGGIIPATGKVTDGINVNSNVNTDISVEILVTTDIPTGTRFHVIIAPTNSASYNGVFAWVNGVVRDGVTVINVTFAAGGQVITWDRRTSGHVGTPIGTAVLAFTGTAGINSVSTVVDYAADAIHEMPAVGTVTPTILWTISQTP